MRSLPPTSSRRYVIQQVQFAGAPDSELERVVPIEAPIAIEVDGSKYAVMMATPADLRDFAIGFALSERIVDRIDHIHDVTVQEVEGGWVLRLTVDQEYSRRACQRSRTRVAESSCGLCGVQSIEQVLRPLPPISARLRTTRNAIARALSALSTYQLLGQATGAVHAAAFCAPDGQIMLAREDVGRHTALDKLIGALASEGLDTASGFFLLSARCSYELVEKTVRIGCPVLVTISAPTSLAIDRAVKAGLTLISLARPDSAMIVCDPSGNIS